MKVRIDVSAWGMVTDAKVGPPIDPSWESGTVAEVDGKELFGRVRAVAVRQAARDTQGLCLVGRADDTSSTRLAELCLHPTCSFVVPLYSSGTIR